MEPPAIPPELEAQIAEIVSDTWTGAETRCFTASLIESISGERLVELTSQANRENLGEPVFANLTDDELESIIGNTRGCIDWGDMITRVALGSMEAGGYEPSDESVACFTEAGRTDTLGVERVVLELLRDPGSDPDVPGFSEHCWELVFQDFLIAAMVEEGVSRDSASCVAERLGPLSAGAEELEWLASGSEIPPDLMRSMLGAMVECLTDEEFARLA